MGFLDGKGALVTGAASGQGRATAIAAAAEGAKVVCMDVTDAQSTVDEIEAAGGVAHAVQGDISNEADWKRAVLRPRRRRSSAAWTCWPTSRA